MRGGEGWRGKRVERGYGVDGEGEEGVVERIEKRVQGGGEGGQGVGERG